MDVAGSIPVTASKNCKMNCNYCNKELKKTNSAINRALKINSPLYCNKTCFGLAKQLHRTSEEKKLLKSKYDKEYRDKNAIKLKLSKHNYYKETYDPLKASIDRKKNANKHLEYCRQPKYKTYKQEYDKKYLAKKLFGEYWESALLIRDIEKEYDQQEVRQLNNLHNKSQKRKRLWKQNYQQLL
jgi:hypothetical protein